MPDISVKTDLFTHAPSLSLRLPLPLPLSLSLSLSLSLARHAAMMSQGARAHPTDVPVITGGGWKG